MSAGGGPARPGDGVRTAVVLAAGLGSRLGDPDRPKPLTEVAGRPLLLRALGELAEAGVREAVVVVGHRHEVIRELVGDRVRGGAGEVAVTYLHSPRYASTNNAYSLWLAREHLRDDAFVVEADVAFDADLLRALARAGGDAASAVAAWRPGMHGTVVEPDGRGGIARLVLARDQRPGASLAGTYKTVNVHLFRGRFLREHFVPRLDASIAAGGDQEYYESVLAGLVDDGVRVAAVDCSALRWCEVDDASDRQAAEFAFRSPAEQRRFLSEQHGSYWRHEVTDHALLYNLYFPPPALLAELAATFPEALTHYPAGQRTHAELLAGIVAQPPARLVVANGAAELIKVLGRVLGPTTVVVPNFNEYESVLAGRGLERFELPAPRFALDAGALVDRVRRSGSRAVVLTTPNNPTSIAVPREDLLSLCGLLAPEGVTVVVDESFVDFCARDESVEPYAGAYPNLLVVKSMSKVFGIGGVRLGYALGADLDLVARIRAELPIWNLNGVAEAFLRLLPRYRRQFAASCASVRADRDELYAMLREVPGLTVCRPDANYVFVRLPEGWSADGAAQRLYASARILVKDCGGKSMADGHRWLRLSSRQPHENARLVEALRGTLHGRVPAGAVAASSPRRGLVRARLAPGGGGGRGEA